MSQQGPEDFIPLHSVEAEMGALGSMLLSERAADEVTQILTIDDFYRPAHRLVFRAMLQLRKDLKPIDFLTLKTELVARGNLADIGGEDTILQLAEFVPSPANAEYYAQIVVDRARLRRLETAGRDIVGLVHNPNEGDAAEKIDKAEQMVFSIGKGTEKEYFQPVKFFAKQYFQKVDDFYVSKIPETGVKVGFHALDDLTTGFYPGDFIIIGGRPAMGKTSLVLDFALNVARTVVREESKGSVAFFSLEMGGIQLAQRFISMMSGISARSIRQREPLSDQKYDRLAEACEDLFNLPIFIDDGSDINPLEVRGKCRRLKSEHGLSLVIVDYLQLMRGSRRTDNRVQEISEIARACKNMAKELEVPVIALSQLSRSVESREDKRPQLSDLRESGSIEAEADMVMLLYRDSYYKAKEEHRKEVENFDDVQTAEVIVAKHRNGPVGTVKLGFQPVFARFRNIVSDDSIED
jgi:replicative DNA helicase